MTSLLRQRPPHLEGLSLLRTLEGAPFTHGAALATVCQAGKGRRVVTARAG